MTLSRRDALKLGGLTMLGGAALGVPLGRGAQTKGATSQLSAADFPKLYTAVITKTPAATPTMVGGVAHYDFTLRREPAVQILTGSLKTPVFGYDGVFPGPRIELDRGTPAVVRQRNQLPAVGPFGSPARTSTHLHGSASLPEYDGYANDTTAVGQYKDYHYPNFQPARTLWYHDHGVHWTAQQAYGGLAAMYVMHDKDEQTLLPKGEFDIPLLVNDAIFGADGQLLYNDNLHSGLWGDVILVNGRPWPVMQVQRRTYRFRVLNCSISRSFTWRLSNGMPLQVVATDGGLMPQGVAVTSMRHAGAERYEIVIDFSKVPASTKRIELLNDSNQNNIDYDFTGKVMAFDLLDGPVSTTRSNYDQPSVQEPDPTWDRNYHNFPLVRSEVMDLPVTGNYTRRHFRLKRDDVTQEWRIDDRSWNDVVASNFTAVMANPAIDDVEIWEFENSSGGWFHPVHIHLVDFRIIERIGGVGQVLPHEQGPKDVMYVGEGETVHVLVKFNKPGVTKPSGDPDFKGGRYMVHCHNLPHEDHDMMNQFSIGSIDFSGSDPHHPIDAARPMALTVPGAPAMGTATAGNASATVGWTPPATDGGSLITGYTVRVLNPAGAQVGLLRPAGAGATSLVVTGLTNGTTYRFRVRAINAAGSSALSGASNPVTPTEGLGVGAVPGAPTIRNAVAGAAGGAITATANWWAHDNTGSSPITGYQVTAIRTGVANIVELRTPLAGRDQTLVMTLPAGNYRFTVVAINSTGPSLASGQSNLVTAR